MGWGQPNQKKNNNIGHFIITVTVHCELVEIAVLEHTHADIRAYVLTTPSEKTKNMTMIILLLWNVQVLSKLRH